MPPTKKTTSSKIDPQHGTYTNLRAMATPAPSLDGAPLAPAFSHAPPAPTRKAVPPPPPETFAAELAKIGSPAPSLAGAPSRAKLDQFADYELISVDDLIPDPNQPRKTITEVDEMKESLKTVGMLQPIIARWVGENRMIMFGERRWRAAKALHWTHVPVITRRGSTGDVLKKQLQENTQRAAMDPVDIANAIRQIMRDEKLATHLQAAESLGHSQFWVSRHLALLELDEADQRAVSVGAISIAEGAARGRAKAGVTRASRKSATKAKTIRVPVRASKVEVTEVTSASQVEVKKAADSTDQEAYFNNAHVLAAEARAKCRMHMETKLPGGVACGECWESVIRKDALKLIMA